MTVISVMGKYYSLSKRLETAFYNEENIMKEKIKDIATMMTTNESTLFIYALAYSIITGVAPLLIIMVVYMGTYVYNVDQIVSLLQRYIPEDLILPFVSYIQASEMTSKWFIVSLLGVSIWVASKSIYSFLLRSSVVDNVNVNNFVLRILAMIYFVIIILGIGFVSFLMGYFPYINRFVLPLLMFVFFVIVYKLLSFRYTGFRDVVYGAVFSSITLSLLGRLFFQYINQYSNYQTIYGPLASLMIMLISGWFIAWVVYCGYCINYVFRHTDGPVKEKEALINFLEKQDE